MLGVCGGVEGGGDGGWRGGGGGGQTMCYVVQYSTVLEHQWSCCGGHE